MDVLHDLRVESGELDDLVAPLDDWSVPTPAEGWTIAHQVAHLAWTDRASLLAVRDPDAFTAGLAGYDERTVDRAAAEGAERPDLLAHWRTGRDELSAALAEVPAGEKLVWFGPRMSATSMATARLMETWAHGQDVADALGVVRAPSDRLRHVAHIGARTVAFAFLVNNLAPPTDPVRVELAAPGGGVWTWGPEDAENRVTGQALDFCLLVTQRRHRDDLDVTAVGPVAREWLPIAQAFAGPPGGGRARS
ncbi:TIGR03084 family metal-binding protein [Umezawaea sp.]|uniref:TIGR03084 family metal-binding protein n=1 Tax=Umezawaea sp. TaxID=1955258 RepID=UPI002ED0AE95